MYSFAMADLHIDKLSDHFGQYMLMLSCECGHVRECYPKTLAAFAGWDARLADIVRRMRCTKCRRKRCSARAVSLLKPRGLRDGR